MVAGTVPNLENKLFVGGMNAILGLNAWQPTRAALLTRPIAKQVQLSPFIHLVLQDARHRVEKRSLDRCGAVRPRVPSPEGYQIYAQTFN
mmetsp:Transcript_2371/g.6463  ORF Transcript_2371/g.6463 Transcript_2371/m.6463 type:complete len:90 (+) Transcript_2371:92-361(+)